ncbi:MAG: hypothetical protein ACJ762_20290 [Solirubrobacteraceae bacterium]
MTLRARAAALITLAGAAAILPVALGTSAEGGQARIGSTTCANTGLGQGTRMIGAYNRAGDFPAAQVDSGSSPAQVGVTVPPISFSGPGRTRNLPSGPCQHIYRFRYQRIARASGQPPALFRYVEVDWNTEGIARGPANSFVSPHFDFHFYLRPRPVIDRLTRCVSTNGRTCDPFHTGYGQMARFLTLPAARFLPPSYRPDPASSIPRMGLHFLDRAFPYSVHSVDHHPTLLYGSYDGRIIFAEASVTAATLQDVAAAPSGRLTFRYKRPPTVQAGVPWPSRFFLQYLPAGGGFTAGFEGFAGS